MILNSPYISGSLIVTSNGTVSGSLTVLGGITGAITGSATSASYAISASEASKLQGLGSASFAPASTFNTVSQSYAVASGSLSTRVTNLEATSSTVSSSFASTSGSIAGRVTLIEGQYATTGSNNFTKPQQISDVSNAISFTSTASLYTDGGLRVKGSSFISGTAYFNDVVVYGTSSIEYITSSQLAIGTNIITLNTDTPSIRFGGISVFDSGSNNLSTGSLFWDSEKDKWIYSNPSASTYDGGMLISGPRNSSGLGNEVGTTSCALMMGQGGDHITSSAIFSYGNATCFYGNALVVGSNCCVGIGTATPYSNLQVLGTIKVATGNAQGILGLGEGNGATVNVGLWRGAANNPTSDGNYLNIGGYEGIVFAASNAAIGSQCERMRITSTGAVGIGSNAPTTDDGNLVVAGAVGTGQGITCTTAQINIWETTSGNKAGLWFGAVNCANVGVIGSRTATGNIAFQTYCGAWGERMRITYNGNVGIGTTSPVGKLDVSLLNTRRFIVTYDDSIITIKGASDTGAGENLRVIGDNLIFNTNSVGSGTERLRISSTGIACFACQVCLPTSNTSLVAGTFGTISNVGGIDTNIGNNAYYDGTNWRRFAAQEAARIYINRDSFSFLRKASDGAGSCISWDNTLFLSSTGIACFACQVCSPRFQADNYGIFRASAFRGGLYTYDAVVGSGTDYGVTIFAEGGANNGNIYFAPGGSATKAVTITCFGEMLINTTTDYGNYKLQVVGQIASLDTIAIANGTQSAGSIASRLYLGNRGYFTDPATAAAMITSKTEGTFWYSGTAMEFYTTPGPDATSNTPQLRMTINKDGNIGAPSGTNIYNASDLRLKRNISNIADGLSKIMCLNPVKFNWIENYIPSEENKDMLGFIAQEIQNIIPEAVETFASGNSITVNDAVIDSPLRVNEKFIIPVLVKAIQEQQCEIKQLKTCLGIN